MIGPAWLLFGLFFKVDSIGSGCGGPSACCASQDSAASRRPLKKSFQRPPRVVSGVFVAARDLILGWDKVVITFSRRSRPGPPTPHMVLIGPSQSCLQNFSIFQRARGYWVRGAASPQRARVCESVCARSTPQRRHRFIPGAPCFGGAAPCRSSDNNTTILGRHQKTRCPTAA